MTDSLIMSMYEEGRTVKEIAEAVECTPSEVTALLASGDDTQTVQVARQEKHTRQIRRVRALADGITLSYLEKLQPVITDSNTTADEKAKAFTEIDKVIRISKLYSDRVLLAEGKTTENVGVNGSAEIPFTVIFTNTYETPLEAASDLSPQSSEKKDETTDYADYNHEEKKEPQKGTKEKEKLTTEGTEKKRVVEPVEEKVDITLDPRHFVFRPKWTGDPVGMSLESF